MHQEIIFFVNPAQAGIQMQGAFYAAALVHGVHSATF
jgi:hypothetical protein